MIIMFWRSRGGGGRGVRGVGGGQGGGVKWSDVWTQLANGNDRHISVQLQYDVKTFMEAVVASAAGSVITVSAVSSE